MVEQLALCGVGDEAIFLVAAFDVVEVGQLFLVVGGAELLCALEHEVLKVVGETRGLVRVVAASRAHGDVGLDARLLFVYRQIDGEAVFKCVDAALHHVTLYRLVVVGRGMERESEPECNCCCNE